MTKIREELDEVTEALEGKPDREAAAEEIGDLFFAIANLARKLDIDPEASLSAANRKFQRRFEVMESYLGAERLMSECTGSELDALWRRAKKEGQPGSKT